MNLKASVNNPIVFLDRDGVITKLPSYMSSKDLSFLTKIEDIQFIPNAIEAIKILTQNNIPLFIITNQPQIAKGLASIEQIIKINEEIERIIKENGGNIIKTYFCPHHPKGNTQPYNISCYCRKPKTGLIELAKREYNLDLTKAYLIGDTTSDILTGKNAGCKTMGVGTGYKCEDKWYEIKPDYKVNNLLEAAEIILNK